MQGEIDGTVPALAALNDVDHSGRDKQGQGVTRSRKALRYFQERAEQELECAELADHPDAARAHSLLAGYYLDLVHSWPEATVHASRPIEEERRDV